MAGDRHFRRWFAVAAGIACALVVLLLWLWPREPAPAEPVVAGSDGRASGTPPRPAAGRRARRASRHGSCGSHFQRP